MVKHASAERVRGAILQRCRSGLGARALRIAVIEELRRSVEFDGYVWVLTDPVTCVGVDPLANVPLSLIHISEPTRLGMISYAVFCLKKKKKQNNKHYKTVYMNKSKLTNKHKNKLP